MRGSRSLLVLLVLAAGLGAYIYFVEANRDLTDPATRKGKVFTVETGKIEEISIRAVSGETTTVRKTGEDWQVVAPAAAPADQGVVSSLASSLETLEMQESLEDNPASVAAFGVEPPRLTVTFKVAGDSSAHTLNVGNKTPTGSDLYARVAGQPRLFLISGFLEDTFNRSTFDLRDKTILKVAASGVDAIRLEPAAAPAVALARTNNAWRVTVPVDARADFSPVDGLINRASSAQAKAVVAGEQAPPTAAELKTFGLDKPQLVATFGTGSSRASLAIGAKKDDMTHYARDVSSPIVYAVESSLLTDLTKSADDLRVKDVFEFKSFTAVALEITQGATTHAFGKAKPAGAEASSPDVWKATKPEAKDVNQTGITDLLNTLSSLRAEKFAARVPAGSADVVVAARFGDAAAPTEERVTLRKVGTVVYAVRSGEAGAAIVPTADFDKALTQLKDLTGGK